MQAGLAAFLFSLLAVTLAEMGDKTQLLAMAFAARFKWWKVLLGVFVATVLNHALAVALGSLLGRIESVHLVIQIITSASFILFGLWTLRGDALGGERRKKSCFGAVLTVGIAFFLAEFGDKTQLTTVALAARYPQSPGWILMGTTLGMVIADGFGILVGVVFCKRIPERIIRTGSAGVFMLFGLYSTYELFREELAMEVLLRVLLIAALFLCTCALSLFAARKSTRHLTHVTARVDRASGSRKASRG